MKPTILVVDDTPTNLQILVRFLSNQDWRILVAEDGLSALEQIGRTKPDLVLLDIMMPRLDGYETCKRIRQIPETKDIPVIFMTALSDMADKLKGFEVGAVDYITKPYQKEEVLARVKAHLTIVQQRSQLQAMFDQRGRFMRIAAHDLRNPISVLSGWAWIGQGMAPSDQIKKLFQNIEHTAQQMEAIIKDFLSLNVVQSGEKGQGGQFDLRSVLAQVVDQQGMAAQSKGTVLQASLPAECRAFGLADHTHQIVTNYITNAVKYSPPNSLVKLSVAAVGEFWRVAVLDQGPGVPPEERTRLFIEFAKISTKPTAGEISTGLGLAIVKSLAENQGGKVGADFPAEGGSLFWVDIPMRPQALGPKSLPA